MRWKSSTNFNNKFLILTHNLAYWSYMFGVNKYNPTKCLHVMCGEEGMGIWVAYNFWRARGK